MRVCYTPLTCPERPGPGQPWRDPLGRRSLSAAIKSTFSSSTSPGSSSRGPNGSRAPVVFHLLFSLFFPLFYVSLPTPHPRSFHLDLVAVSSLRLSSTARPAFFLLPFLTFFTAVPSNNFSLFGAHSAHSSLYPAPGQVDLTSCPPESSCRHSGSIRVICHLGVQVIETRLPCLFPCRPPRCSEFSSTRRL